MPFWSSNHDQLSVLIQYERSTGEEHEAPTVREHEAMKRYWRPTDSPPSSRINMQDKCRVDRHHLHSIQSQYKVGGLRPRPFLWFPLYWL